MTGPVRQKLQYEVESGMQENITIMATVTVDGQAWIALSIENGCWTKGACFSAVNDKLGLTEGGIIGASNGRLYSPNNEGSHPRRKNETH